MDSSSVVALIITVVLGGGLLQAIRALLKLPSDRDVSVATAYSTLVSDLRTRIEDVEAQLLEERKTCERQIAAMGDRISELEGRLAV